MTYRSLRNRTMLSLVSAAIFLAASFCQPTYAKDNSGARPPLIPAGDFFRNPEITGYQLSPDGGQLAYLKPAGQRLNIFVQSVGAKEARQITGVTARDIRSYFWKTDKTIIYRQDFSGDENYHIYAADVETGQTRDLTPFAGVRATIIDSLPDNAAEILVGLNQRNPEIFDVYRLDLATGALKLEIENPGVYTGYLADHQGVVRVAYGKDRDSGENLLYYRPTAVQPFKLILSTDYRDSADALSFDDADKNLYLLSNIGRDKQALVVFNPDTAQEEKVLCETPVADIAGAAISRKSKKLLSAYFVTDKVNRYFFDNDARQMYNRLKRHFGRSDFRLVSTNKDEDKYIVAEYSDTKRGTYYFYNKTKDKLVKLADTAPWLNAGYMAAMRPIHYTSRDGYRINGYLTLPKGRAAKNLPVVVVPHGGPWARDYWGYQSDVQFLANRGYAVLQMNFRGSTGYGKAFVDAGNKEWGRKMQDDITDGVNWLIGKGIADPQRIGIYGGSYGGYAVLAGLAFTPDLYACGVDLVGPSNLFTLIASLPPYWKPMIAEFYERVGNPEKDAALLREVSPVFHADQIKVPLFVAQGAHDPRVNMNESDQIVQALRARGVAVEYMVKSNEGHGFANEENRLEFFEAMEKFLAKYLKPEA